MSGLTKTEKKHQHALRASSSAGTSSPSVASTVKKRSVDSVMKRKASLDSIVNKRMRSKNSGSKLSVSHGTSPSKSASSSSLISPRGAHWDDAAERPTPESSPFQVHVYAGECPGAHAAFFDAQSAAGGSTKIALLPRTTKLFISNLKKKKNKGRNKKKDPELGEASVVKEDSGDSSTSETKTADAADTADTADADASAPPTANADTATAGLHHVENYDYVLMVLPHSASLAHSRSSSLYVASPSCARASPISVDVPRVVPLLCGFFWAKFPRPPPFFGEASGRDPPLFNVFVHSLSILSFRLPHLRQGLESVPSHLSSSLF